MKIEKTPLENHQIKLVVELDAEPLEQAKQKAARELSKRVKIAGFRPGKAPYAMVLRHLGEAAILEEAVDFLVQDQYPHVIEQAEIKPYGPGSLEKITSIDPPVFEFNVPLQPEVVLGDYQSTHLDYEAPGVNVSEVESVIQRLRDQQAVSEPVDRPAQEGDMVYITLKAFRNPAGEGQSPSPLITERAVPVLVEPESADVTSEWPFAGFSRHLVGLSKGASELFEYTYPEESPYESLRGQQADFSFVVDEVKSHILPELNDEFAQSVGEFSSVEDLKTTISMDLAAQAAENYHAEYDDNALQEIVKISTLKYPTQMVDHELEHVIERLRERLERQGVDFDVYLKSQQKDLDALKIEYRPVAVSRVEKQLVLNELSAAEKVTVEPSEVEAETVRTMSQMMQSLPQAEAKKFSNRDVMNNLVGNVMMDMVIQRTIQRMREIVSGGAYQRPEPVPQATQAESGDAETNVQAEATEPSTSEAE